MIIEISCKNLACGRACPVHYTALFQRPGGYYNSFILQVLDLPSLLNVVSVVKEF